MSSQDLPTKAPRLCRDFRRLNIVSELLQHVKPKESVIRQSFANESVVPRKPLLNKFKHDEKLLMHKHMIFI
jgi:hypothetical protein